MNIYIVTKQDDEGMRLWVYFFLRSALALVARLTDVEAWKEESKPSPWKREQVGKNTVWRTRLGRTVELIPVGLNFRDWSFKRWIKQYFSWQNLNTKGREEVKGSILGHGRAWLRPKNHFSKNARSLALELEWSLKPSLSNLVKFSVDFFSGDSQNDVMVQWTLFGCSFYLSFENALPLKWAANHSWDHGTGFYISEGSLRFELWYSGNDCFYCDGYGTHPKRWTGWHKHIFLREFFLGKHSVEWRELKTDTRLLSMPEKSYEVKITLKERVDSWARWPFKRRMVTSEAEVEGGVPVPGKGENSYDCGQDAIYSQYCAAKTFDEALSSLYASAMRSRERYGGKNWKPENIAA